MASLHFKLRILITQCFPMSLYRCMRNLQTFCPRCSLGVRGVQCFYGLELALAASSFGASGAGLAEVEGSSLGKAALESPGEIEGAAR